MHCKYSIPSRKPCLVRVALLRGDNFMICTQAPDSYMTGSSQRFPGHAQGRVISDISNASSTLQRLRWTPRTASARRSENQQLHAVSCLYGVDDKCYTVAIYSPLYSPLGELQCNYCTVVVLVTSDNRKDYSLFYPSSTSEGCDTLKHSGNCLQSHAGCAQAV